LLTSAILPFQSLGKKHLEQGLIRHITLVGK
jgi:hypothetical protein